MRELHGVIYAAESFSEHTLKRESLLFDSFWVIGLGECLHKSGSRSSCITPTIDFLLKRGVIRYAPSFEGIPRVYDHVVFDGAISVRYFHDLFVRDLASLMTRTNIGDMDVVPVCSADPPPWLVTNSVETENNVATTVCLALKAMPVPDASCAWQDILNFKSEEIGKQWAFRRFLKALSAKNQTEAEVRDDIEWTVSEYRKAMELHRLKSTQSVVDIFVITPLEIMENLVKFNWSKIAKGALSVQKRKVELLEAEMKAPGRECAYVFDARKRFGPK